MLIALRLAPPLYGSPPFGSPSLPALSVYMAEEVICLDEESGDEDSVWVASSEESDSDDWVERVLSDEDYLEDLTREADYHLRRELSRLNTRRRSVSPVPQAMQ